MLIERALIIRDEPTFVVTTGRLTRYYFDCKQVTLDSRGMFLVGNIIFDRIKKLAVKGIGGLTFGADPIANAVAYTAEVKSRYLKAFSVRKEPKGHGTNRWIEGPVQQGDRVVITDDVITTGRSISQAIERATEFGLIIVEVVALIDRQEENGIENIKKHVKDVEAIFKREELIKI